MTSTCAPTTSRPARTTRPASPERWRHELRQRRHPRARDPPHRISPAHARVPGEVLMSASFWIQLVLLIVAVGVTTPLLGGYMAKVYGNAKAPGDRVFLPVEHLIYRICGVDPDREQRWTVYAFSVLAFSLVGILLLYAMQRFQTVLPMNPTA